MNIEKELSLKAMMYAFNAHEQTNHRYNGSPYAVHLVMVQQYVEQFINKLPVSKWEIVRSAAWLHDVIEDCRKTYNDVKNGFGAEVADLVYALTNEKGKNRAERGNEDYYAGIKLIPHGGFIKICDRLANVAFSKYSKSPMLGMYEREHDAITKKLWSAGTMYMFEEFHSLFQITVQ